VGSIRRRVKRFESGVSVCILGILFLIGVGIFIKQSNYDLSRFGMGAAAVPKIETRQSKNDSGFDLSSLVPAGFETLAKAEVYNSENLYEKINGKAPLYIESSFEKLFTQRFASRDNEDLWMELFVFDMAGARNAFSVFSTQRRPDADAVSLFHTSFGYRTGNALYFVHGKYYIELVGSSQSGELFKAITEVAKKTASELAVDKVGRITELGLFPPDNIVEGSIKLYLANAFGFEGLTDTFTAQYVIDGQTITAFLSKRAGITEAMTVAEGYRKFLIENGAVAKKASNKALKAAVFDFYDTTEIVFATGSFVGGIHEAENQQAAEKLAVILINKFNEAISSIKNE